MKCPSCGEFDVGHKELICRLCRVVVLPNPEHIAPIVERVMDEIEETRKDAA